jgi:transposase
MLSFPPSPQVKIFVCREPVDMRKSFDGLSAVVVNVVDHDPQSGHLFVFFNKRKNRMKALVYEPTGCWVLAKRLAAGRFQIFDRVGADKGRFEVTASELALILDGIDLRSLRRQAARREVRSILTT